MTIRQSTRRTRPRYRDACDDCVQGATEREHYIAAPIHLEPLPDDGVRAHYRHHCGARWTCNWARY